MESVEERLSALLARWEEGRRRGQSLTVEELCGDSQELEDELRQRIAQSSARGSGAETADSGSRPSGPTPSASDSSAQTLAGYQIFGELGHGGMGVVYRAFDEKRRRLVAVKMMQHCGPSALYRFKQEFRALADVTHPNLVSLYELVSDGRTWFFTMELVDGVNFLDHVRPRADSPNLRPVSTHPATDAPTDPTELSPETLPGDAPPPPIWDRLRDALRQLARGVSALHAVGKLHRDIKPMNVLVERGGRVVLLDFGLAAELEASGLHQSTEPHALGTIAYMAPEQAAGAPVSPATDWYSVGVILYEALTGRLPFVGKPQDVLLAKQTTEPSVPRGLAADIPPDLDALCTDLLRLDPLARPTGPEVLRRLGVLPEETPESNPSRAAQGIKAPLIGRDWHLRALADAFSAVARGRAVTLLVHGSSGAGKSALVQHFLDGLAARDEAVVLTGRCYERESVPYKALDSLIDALGRYLGHLPAHEAVALLPRDILSLARVFPVLQRVGAVASAPQRTTEVPDPQELRRRAFAALREMMGRIGDRRPLVLAIDDLQWGDVDSAALLADLLRPPDPPVLLLLGSYRSEDATTSPMLRTLLAPPDSEPPALDRRVLAVEPLTPAESRELATQLLGRDPAAYSGAEAVAREAGGSPFFVQELVRYVQAGAGLAARPAPGEEITLDRVLWTRIERLPEAARRLLEAVAVSGRPLRQGDAFRAAGLGPEGFEALAVLRSSRLIRGMGPAEEGEVETYHDRVRETVAAHLTADALAGHHLHLAEALEASGGADAEALAVHFRGANRHEKAGEYYARAAAEAAEALAFERAAKLYRFALELRPDDVAAASALRARLGDALANAGRGSEAAREYLAAAAGTESAGALELRRCAAFQYLISGHIDAGLIELRTVLQGVGMRLPSSPWRALLSLLRQRFLVRLRGLGFHERRPDEIAPDELLRIDICDSASVGLGAVDPICGAAVQARTLLLSLRSGEPSRIARALAWEACHVSTSGESSRRRTERLLRTGEILADRVAHPRVFGAMALARGITAFCAGGWKRALEHTDDADSILRDQCTGAAWELDTAHTFALWSLTYMGEVVELTRRRRVLLQEAEERGDLYALTNLSTYIMAIVQLGAESPGEARAELSRAEKRWTQKGFHVQHHNALLARVYIDLYSGDGDAARHHIREKWPAYASSLLLRVQQIRVDAIQLRSRSALAAAVNSADPRPLLRSAERDARRLQRERIPWALAHAAYLRAAIAQARGETSAAQTGLARAASLYDAADMPLYAAAARRRLGASIGGAEGDAMVTQTDALMAAQSIRNPARMAAMYAPGDFPT